ncbi:MAG: hypothetical protein ACREDF_02170, partial [Thermoplasmata archaeon]
EEKPAIPGTAVSEGEGEEAEPVPLEEAPAPAMKISKSRDATKRLKKLAKVVKDLGVDAEVEPEGGDET